MHSEMLSHLCLTAVRRPGEGKKDYLFASYRADVVVHTHDVDTRGLLYHRLHDWTGRFDQMGPHLFQQVPAFFGRKRLDQVLLGGGQDALKTHDDEITEKVGADVLGATAHVILLEAADPLANGRFDLSVGFHGNFLAGSHENRL